MLPIGPFGRTGHDSTRIIFGAAALGGMSQARADLTLELIDEAGVNHIDTAASYGASEDRLAPFLSHARERFFLATKTGERDGAAARGELERSLTRMGVESVDLIQLHNLVEPDEWETAFSPNGVVDAMRAARDEGLANHIGVTGHGLRIASVHLRSLERFDFDSVLFPVNHALIRIPEYRDDVEALRERCRDHSVAMQTIKSVARRRWSDPDVSHFSWYQPLDEPAAIGRAIRFVLAEPDQFVNTTSDARLLPLIFEAATGDLGPPTDDELADDSDRLGITPLFDGSSLERI